MNIIHFSTVFRRLDHFVKLHNSNSPILSTHLRQPIVATAKEIIKIYSLSLLKAHKISPLDLDNIPPLETNSVQLATMTNVSPRTIRRHIRRLLDANVLTEKVFKGRKANYELRFNLDILLINGVKAVKRGKKFNEDQKSKKTDYQFFKNSMRTRCPQPNPSNNSYIHNILIVVDKKLNRSSLSLTPQNLTSNASSNNFSRYAEEEGAKKSNELPTQGKLGAKFLGQKKAPNDNFCDDAEEEENSGEVKKQAKDTASRLETSRLASFNPYVDSLWELSKDTIYKDTFLTKDQQVRAKELLRDWYAPVAEPNLAKVHHVYTQRIALVQRYIAKDPENRYVQLPHRYFDVNNKHGFAGTKVWYEKQIRSKRKTRLKLILHAQIRRFLNNEKKDTSKQVSRLQLFRQCEARIGELKDQELLDQFYACILDKTTFNFLQSNTHLRC
ncbi:hypothetical protein U8527_10300 [Kordia algicida OT-1]|uniref:Uncharacterized protein n=1 Tax=Kordia algicida OT-1 TaxID=391587 RepID=A9DW15_9FLAO|nr:hypothetical protein [Kordia algicida]EDP96496.1 hypothetical protein KAOT1_03767 [Kordia algicida OT-1]